MDEDTQNAITLLDVDENVDLETKFDDLELDLDSPKEEKKTVGMKKKLNLTIETKEFVNPLNQEQEAYKEKIKEFVEMETLKLVFRACQTGLTEQEVKQFIKTHKVADFDLENFKSRFKQAKEEEEKSNQEEAKE